MFNRYIKIRNWVILLVLMMAAIVTVVVISRDSSPGEPQFRGTFVFGVCADGHLHQAKEKSEFI